MDPEYARRYREMWERHWWWQARRRLITATLHRIRPHHGWRRILDVGCGDGLFFHELSKFGDVEGVEPNASLLTREDVRDRIHLGAFDERLGLKGRYSLILMLDVLEHLSAPAGALSYANRLLEPGGTVLVTVPALNLLWTHHDVINDHHTRYTRRSFRRLAAEAGFHVKEIRYFFHWTVPVKLGMRLAEALFPIRPEPARIPPAPVNRLCYGITRLEQRLLGKLPIPVGSSLMVIGGASET